MLLRVPAVADFRAFVVANGDRRAPGRAEARQLGPRRLREVGGEGDGQAAGRIHRAGVVLERRHVDAGRQTGVGWERASLDVAEQADEEREPLVVGHLRLGCARPFVGGVALRERRRGREEGREEQRPNGGREGSTGRRDRHVVLLGLVESPARLRRDAAERPSPGVCYGASGRCGTGILPGGRLTAGRRHALRRGGVPGEKQLPEGSCPGGGKSADRRRLRQGMAWRRSAGYTIQARVP